VRRANRNKIKSSSFLKKRTKKLLLRYRCTSSRHCEALLRRGNPENHPQKTTIAASSDPIPPRRVPIPGVQTRFYGVITNTERWSHRGEVSFTTDEHR
jgi:hypothetical protein